MRGVAASWIVFGDGERAALRDGALVLDGDERIVALGEERALRAEYPQVAWTQHAAVITPGFVNAHTHLELSALRGRAAGGRGFVPWLDGMMSERGKSVPEQDAEAIDTAISDLLGFGVVAIGEVSNSLAAVSALGEVPLLGCVFHEVFGMRKDTGEVALGLARQARAEHASWPKNLRYALAPHTPYTLHPDVLKQIVAAAQAAGARTSLHLAEHAAERAFLESGGGPFADWLVTRRATELDWKHPGASSVQHADALGVLGPELIAVHLCDARREELAIVAQRGCQVVLCPRSNLHIELKLPPLLEILHVGIKPGLGTDSLASNASLDPLAEARALHQRFPTVPARSLLAMATDYGARALGLAHQLGRLEAGLVPGLVAFEHAAGSVPADAERFVLESDKAKRTIVSRPAYHRLGISETHA